MDNGSVEVDDEAFMRLAEALGHVYNPYAEQSYVEEATRIILELRLGSND